MTSEQSVEDSTLLEACISKKRSIEDIYEDLGIFALSAKNIWDPVFHEGEVNELHRRIINIARSFTSSPTNNTVERAAALLKPDTFSSQIDDLMKEYGERIWTNRDEGPRWHSKAGQMEIRFHVRCWITRQAVQFPNSTPRKRKARAKVKSVEVIRSDESDSDGPLTPAYPNRKPHPALDTSAPEAPSMIPSSDSNHREGNADISASSIRSPITPSKRKATDTARPSSEGKLQKVRKDARGEGSLTQRQLGDVFELPDAPVPASYPHRPALETQRQREMTTDTQTVIGDSEVLEVMPELSDDEVDNQDTRMDEAQLPIAGPSGTQPHSGRRDSVVLVDSRPVVQSDQLVPSRTNPMTNDITCVSEPDVYRLDDWQKRQLRIELFKLLLSLLNSINQFDAKSYQHTAEERMNMLLCQFWFGESGALRLQLDKDFDRIRVAFGTWMQMRHQLNEFRVATGYMGRPGEEWKNHLRRMEGVARAKSGIEFANLKAVSSAVGMPWLEPTYEDDLATIFDALTQIEGCNGKEEFGGLRLFNEALLEWFV